MGQAKRDLIQGVDYKEDGKPGEAKGKSVLLRAQVAATASELDPVSPTFGSSSIIQCTVNAAGTNGSQSLILPEPWGFPWSGGTTATEADVMSETE